MTTMSRLMIGLAVAVVAIPAVAYFVHRPSRDPLADRLRAYGFFPVDPPNATMKVGGLYYVSADTRTFVPICEAERADLDPAVRESPSVRIEEDLAQEGGLTARISFKFKALVEGSSDASYVQKAHFSLTDIVLQEIALGPGSLIYTKLMNRSECSSVAVQLVNTDGYVCQGQRILRATAAYTFDRDGLTKLGGRAGWPAGQAGGADPIAIDVASEQRLVQRAGKLVSGSALDYGVAFAPTCLAPEGSRFARVLPTSRLGRGINYVLYHVIEPLLPATHDEVDLAQGAPATAK